MTLDDELAASVGTVRSDAMSCPNEQTHYEILASGGSECGEDEVPMIDTRHAAAKHFACDFDADEGMADEATIAGARRRRGRYVWRPESSPGGSSVTDLGRADDPGHEAQ